MKITKTQLRKIIKEEILHENEVMNLLDQAKAALIKQNYTGPEIERDHTLWMRKIRDIAGNSEVANDAIKHLNKGK